MMSRHFGLSSELTGAIAKRLPHAKNQLSVPGSFFNQFVTYIYIYIYTSALRLLALRGLRTLLVRRFTQWALADIRERIRRFLVLYLVR